MPPQKVAIIGAGPSGLVTAKTLLHQFPPDTFNPVIFDRSHEVGGLWPLPSSSSSSSASTQKKKSKKEKVNDGTRTTVELDPCMRTNLSRFTVSFSDLAWESVLPHAEIPIFPRADEVGLYLATYAERYLPAHVLRLGHRVVRAVREGDGGDVRWTVHWAKESESDTQDGETDSETFDLLVVASGFFARPYIPKILGLEHFPGKVIHSSALQNDQNDIPSCNEANIDHGNVIVIGGSMSGVEAASTLALHQSSISLSRGLSAHTTSSTVHHIYSRPFWTLPTYLPHETNEKIISFLPLDLAMYDLARRPPGQIEYSVGPIPEEKAAKTNAYFSSLLGADYERYGRQGFQRHDTNEGESLAAPWVAIGNDYAEFVRSGAITAQMGRAMSVHTCDKPEQLASITIQRPDSQTQTIDNVAAIILATGFTPFDSLSFLQNDILDALEYSANDTFSPLILDQGGTLRTEIPDIGFVGFYRGPYWGVMEMQARLLGHRWAADDNDENNMNSLLKHDAGNQGQRQSHSLRAFRSADPVLRRGQFPMGDYLGLMETFARELDIPRSEILDGGEARSGPVIPARYASHKSSSNTVDMGNALQTARDCERERQITLHALRSTLLLDYHTTEETPTASAAAAAMAVFRALHGTWKIIKNPSADTTVHQTKEASSVSGTLTFHPRYPSDPGYEKEYVCERNEYVQSGYASSTTTSNQKKSYTIFRLPAAAAGDYGSDSISSRIEVWTIKTSASSSYSHPDPDPDSDSNPFIADKLDHVIQIPRPIVNYKKNPNDDDDIYLVGQYIIIHAQCLPPEHLHGSTGNTDSCSYTFYFEGVSISSWERCLDFGRGSSMVEDSYGSLMVVDEMVR